MGLLLPLNAGVTKKTAPRTTGHCCASRNLPCKLPADPRLLDGVAAAAAAFRSALLALQAATRCSGLCALCFAKYVPHALQHLRPALATRQTLVLVVPQLQHICRMDTKDRHTCKRRLTKGMDLAARFAPSHGAAHTGSKDRNYPLLTHMTPPATCTHHSTSAGGLSCNVAAGVHVIHVCCIIRAGRSKQPFLQERQHRHAQHQQQCMQLFKSDWIRGWWIAHCWSCWTWVLQGRLVHSSWPQHSQVCLDQHQCTHTSRMC